MGIIKKFTFDSVDSSTYGIGITGQAVYNAPERDVEMISIPGRNGEYALDHGRFSNIEVTYPAGMGDSDQSTFATRISGLRNALASRVGYKRLEDDYNPNEYRMGVYSRGLEVDPVHYSRAGEFEITFNCKPQRFLKSGETAVSVANNGTISNPTLFDSHPLLEAIGYGDMSINGESMHIYQADLGLIPISWTLDTSDGKYYFDTSNINIGDTVYFHNCKAQSGITAWAGSNFSTWDRTAKTGNGTVWSTRTASNKIIFYIEYDPFTITYGTPKTETTTASYYLVSEQGTSYYDWEYTIEYDGGDYIDLQANNSYTGARIDSSYLNYRYNGTAEANSTKPAVDNTPIYIDLDIGEAYKINNSDIVSVNNLVSLPAELPVLKPGSNAVTYDNTITSFKITPRWWKV